MPSGKSRRSRAAISTVATLAFVCALVSPAVLAAPVRPGNGDLSSRLAALAKPSVRSVSPAKQARKVGIVREGPGSLLRDGNRVLVEVRFEQGAVAGVDDLRAAGAKIVNVSSRYQTVTVAAKLGELRRLSSVPRVAGATEVLAPIVYESGEPRPVTAAVTPCFGAATSEGDEQLRAAQARAEFEVDGSGVKVGILSDSFDQDGFAVTHEAQDVKSGDLPGVSVSPPIANPCGRLTPVDVLEDFDSPEASDEGRAMAQIVHDLAPGASLAFATAFISLTGFAENVEKLRDAGAEVIVDDVAYFGEPFFQEGPVGVAVSDVTASGVSYFTSAGNNNLISGGENIASWEAPQFRLATTCPATLSDVLEYVTECADFDPNPGESDPTFRITVSKGADLLLDLQWAEPWFGVETDFDAYLLDKSGNPILDGEGEVVRSEFANVTKTQRPFELLSWENESGSAQEVQVVVNRYTGLGGGGTAAPTLKFALLQNGSGVTSTEYPESSEGDVVGPTIFGHNGAKDAMSVGAIRYNSNAAPEVFSSRGPVTHHFEPVNGVLPAAELPSPETLAKPDLVATDGGANTFFGSCVSDAWRFFGTSAAAPHAAAIAALQHEAQPAPVSAEEVNDAQRDSGVAVGAFPPDAVGTGMVDSVAAIEGLGVSPSSPGAPTEPAPSPVSCASIEPEPEQPNPQPQLPSNSGSGPGTGQGPSGAVDRTPPSTFFRLRPPRVLLTANFTAKAVFRFGSNESGVSFLCKLDRAAYRLCGTRTVRRLGQGPHVLRVKARDEAGNTDSTPAVYRFRVKQV